MAPTQVPYLPASTSVEAVGSIGDAPAGQAQSPVLGGGPASGRSPSRGAGGVVGDVLGECLHRTESARVQNFGLVLAEREAKRRLASLTMTDPEPGADHR